MDILFVFAGIAFMLLFVGTLIHRNTMKLNRAVSQAQRAARWHVREESEGDELAGDLRIVLVKTWIHPDGGERQIMRIPHAAIPRDAADWEGELAIALATANSKCTQLNDAAAAYTRSADA